MRTARQPFNAAPPPPLPLPCSVAETPDAGPPLKTARVAQCLAQLLASLALRPTTSLQSTTAVDLGPGHPLHPVVHNSLPAMPAYLLPMKPNVTDLLLPLPVLYFLLAVPCCHRRNSLGTCTAQTLLFPPVVPRR